MNARACKCGCVFDFDAHQFPRELHDPHDEESAFYLLAMANCPACGTTLSQPVVPRRRNTVPYSVVTP